MDRLFCLIFVLPKSFSPPSKLQQILSSKEGEAKSLFLAEEERLLNAGKVGDAKELCDKYLNSSRYSVLGNNEKVDLLRKCFELAASKYADFANQFALYCLKEIFAVVKSDVRHGICVPGPELHSLIEEVAGSLLERQQGERNWSKIMTVFADRIAIPRKEGSKFEYGVYKCTIDSSNEVVSLFHRPRRHRLANLAPGKYNSSICSYFFPCLAMPAAPH